MPNDIMYIVYIKNINIKIVEYTRTHNYVPK